MSVHFISGKPGGGKSLYSVRLIVDELVKGHRVIVTNVPIKPAELNAYLQKNYPDRVVDLFKRLRLLDDEETGHFWTFRGEGSTGPRVVSPEEWKAGIKPDYSGVKDDGVLYVIDEVHNFFNARAWMETGKDVLFYLSQHRKLGDTVLAITQSIGNVDKQFRSVTQDYTYLRNLCKERYGYFKLPSVFLRQTYLSPATDTSHPMESGTFKLDVSGLAACYDTAKGVGIHGRVGDVGERRGGLPWWVGVGMVILLCCGVAWGVPKGVAAMFKTASPVGERLASNFVGVASSPVASALASGPPAAPPGGLSVGVSTSQASSSNAVAVPLRDDELNADLYLVRYARLLDKAEWVLSDGRIVYPRDSDFRRGNEREVVLRDKGIIRRRGRLDPFQRAPLASVHHASQK